jgi:hypothetical protein
MERAETSLFRDALVERSVNDWNWSKNRWKIPRA